MPESDSLTLRRAGKTPFYYWVSDRTSLADQTSLTLLSLLLPLLTASMQSCTTVPHVTM